MPPSVAVTSASIDEVCSSSLSAPIARSRSQTATTKTMPRTMKNVGRNPPRLS
jgi:hypothetical protein